MFDADRPIANSDEDRLNRAQFARYLARCMLDHQDPNSLVVGLYGGWGVGKTSIINMTVEELNFAASNMFDNEKPVILNFSPWSYSGQEQLIYNFFRRLSAVIREASYVEDAEHIIYLLELYVSFFTNKPIPKPLRQKKSLWQRLTKKEQPQPLAWESGRDLTQVKAELNELLRNQKHKIIIIIDNISRIRHEEIKQVFQIVKSMGDYANTAYLLAFDKEHVIHAIDQIDGGGGEDYLEKVVQLPFDVPPISEQDIEAIFIDRLQDIVNTIPDDVWDTKYWAEIYYTTLKYFFTNCRDVSRYINLLNFSYPRMHDIVNPVDYFALTAIEIFMPDVYAGIRDNKDLFTDLLDHVYVMDKEQIEKDKARCDEIINRDNRIPAHITKSLLMRLFPRLRHIYQPETPVYHSEEIARKLKRACSPDLFDAYFRLSMQSSSIAKAEFSVILAVASDKEQFDHALARLNQDDRVLQFLNQLDGKVLDELPHEHISAIIHALIDNGDLFPIGEKNSLTLDTPMRIHRIIHRLLKRIKTTDERYNMLEYAISNTTKSLYVPVNELNEQSREHNQDEDTFMPLEYRDITPDQLDKLKQLVVNLIISWAKHDRLQEHPRLIKILKAWTTWSDPGVCRQYVEKITSTDRGLVYFLVAALSKPIDEATTNYEKTTSWDKCLEDMNEFIDPYSLEEHTKLLFEDGYFEKLREREQLAIIIFLDLMKSSSTKVIPNTSD